MDVATLCTYTGYWVLWTQADHEDPRPAVSKTVENQPWIMNPRPKVDQMINPYNFMGSLLPIIEHTLSIVVKIKQNILRIVTDFIIL